MAFAMVAWEDEDMGGWSPGDLSPSAMIVTASYLISAAACVLMVRQQRAHPHARTAWILLATAFLAVAIERQLGLLDLVTAVMRTRAEIAGDYALRRTGQAKALRVIAIIALVTGTLLAALARRAGGYAAAATVLVTLIVAYPTAKAVSLHAVDELVFRRVDGVAVGNWIEFWLAGAAMVTVALALAGERRRDAVTEI